MTKSQLKEIIKEVISEARQLQAISSNKVHPFITAKRIILKGKLYDEVDFEVLKVDNNNKTIQLKVLAPKDIFGKEIKVTFREVRMGPWFKTDTSKVFKESDASSNNINDKSLNEGTFVFHYGEGTNRVVHQLKAFRLEDALKKFIDMYKIPQDKWSKILISKNKWF
jgi:hypothetical protein